MSNPAVAAWSPALAEGLPGGQTTIPGVGAVPTAAVAAAAIVVLTVVLLAIRRRRSQSEDLPEAELGTMLEEHREQVGADTDSAGATNVGEEVGPGASAAGEGRTVGDIDEHHQQLLAAPEIELDRRMPEVGGELTKTLVATEFPDFPRANLLSDLFEVTDARFDVTVYFYPKVQDAAREELKDHADDLDVDSQMDDSARASYIAAEAEKAQVTSDAAQSGTRIFDMSLFVTVRGDTQEEVEENERKLRKALTKGDRKKKIDIKVFPGKQAQAIQSASPLGRSVLSEAEPERFRHVAMAGAVGCLLASPHNPTFMEESGFEVGLHKQTQVPVMMDPMKREGGHAWGIIGHPGAGKSRSAKSAFLEYVGKHDDVTGIVIEPLGNWRGVVEAAREGAPEDMKAEHVIVGGDRGLNPLEIKPTPDHVLRAQGGDFDPLSERKNDVMRFFENLLTLRGMELGEHREMLEKVVDDVYADAGITGDPATHGRDSPTSLDVVQHLVWRARYPEEFANVHASQVERIREHALWLLDRLSVLIPEEKEDEVYGEEDLGSSDDDDEDFETSGEIPEEVRESLDRGSENRERRYANFAQESELELEDSDIVYLDLARTEGSMDEKAILTLQTLISQVYEVAKNIEDDVVIAMDEFHYLLDEERMDLGFLNLLFRHMRHNGISPWLMTQGLTEFMEHPEGEEILDYLTMKQFHAIRETNEEWLDTLNMTEKVLDAIDRLQPGSEEMGYSPAIVEIDGEWREVEVRTPPKQADIIEWEPEEQPVTDLPGITLKDGDDRRRAGGRDDPASGESQNNVSTAEQD